MGLGLWHTTARARPFVQTGPDSMVGSSRCERTPRGVLGTIMWPRSRPGRREARPSDRQSNDQRSAAGSRRAPEAASRDPVLPPGRLHFLAHADGEDHADDLHEKAGGEMTVNTHWTDTRIKAVSGRRNIRYEGTNKTRKARGILFERAP